MGKIGISFLLFFVFIVVVVLISIKNEENEERNQIVKQVIKNREIISESKEIIKKYAKNLGRERFANSSTDPYGIRRYEKWEKKGIVYFFNKVLLPEHSASEDIEQDSSIKSEIMTLIDEAAIANEFKNKTLKEIESGEEYEIFCEKILEESGWKVTRTPKTGDHGVDLVAAKDNFRVCLQCKKYTKPVGNSAVQEITAGKTHYQGTHSGVVTNNSFTKKAIELAESNNVMLLHHDELDNLEKILTEANL